MLKHIKEYLDAFKYQVPAKIDDFNNSIKIIKEHELKLGIKSDEIKLYPNKYPKGFKVFHINRITLTDLIQLYTTKECHIMANKIRCDLFGVFTLAFARDFNKQVPASTTPNSQVPPKVLDIREYLMDVKLTNIDLDPTTGLITLDFGFCDLTKKNFNLQRLIDLNNMFMKFTRFCTKEYYKTYSPKIDDEGEMFGNLRNFIRRGRSLDYIQSLDVAQMDIFKEYRINIFDSNNKKYTLSYGTQISTLTGQMDTNKSLTTIKMDKFILLNEKELGELTKNYMEFLDEDRDRCIGDIGNQFESIKNKFKKEN